MNKQPIIEYLTGEGAYPDEPDGRDLFIATAGQSKVDWEKGFDIYHNLDLELEIKNQGSSLSCVGQAVAYYAEVLQYIEVADEVEPEDYREFSAKSIYAQIRLPERGGSYLRDGVKTMVDYGINSEDVVESGSIEDVYLDKGFLTKENIAEAKIYQSEKFYMTAHYNDIDAVAEAIEVGNGAIIGFWGSNSGMQTAFITPPPEDYSERIWGHAVYGCGFLIINGKKYIKFVNSWGKSWGEKGFGYISEDYFKAKRVFSPWTLIDKKNTMANFKVLIVRDGQKWGVGIDTDRNLFVEYASSEEEYKLLGKKFGVEVIKKDGTFVEPNLIIK